MKEPEAYTRALGSLVTQLLECPCSYSRLNIAAAEADRLGRELHGFGFLSEQEIAMCLMDAVRGLGEARNLADSDRPGAVAVIAGLLGEAVTLAEAGVRPYETDTGQA